MPRSQPNTQGNATRYDNLPPELAVARKLIPILEDLLRRRFAGKNSVQWGKLLDVSPDAVRGYRTWKLLQQARKAGD